MTASVLTHEEAVREVYRLTPQIRDYDEFMYLGVRWMPYTMFFQHPNYRSPTINTDRLGFRLSDVRGRSIGVADVKEHERVSLIVGGSTVLGTGATSDSHTLASCLSRMTGRSWLNFSCRGYNATQELLLFLMHQHRFSGGIDDVVVFSGINTLALEGMPEEFASDHGRYYYSYEFAHYMEQYNVDLKRRRNTYASALDERAGRRSALRNLLSRGSRPMQANPTDKVIEDEDVGVGVRVGRAADTTLRALAQWKSLLAPFDARLSFALQPMASWAKSHLHPAEEEIFHAIDSCPNNFWRMFSHVLGGDAHDRFAEALQKGCSTIDVGFTDMNALLRDAKCDDDDIFVDRVHFNDHGHERVAALVRDFCVSCQ